ncbi:MAG: alpha/beta hydrolase [Actinomycetota bacterium]|nr:alpha/beta hydrolase [Actinomycetota bacterium]
MEPIASGRAVNSAGEGNVELAYEVYGDAGDPPIVLVNGLGNQMIHYDTGFVAALVERGLRPIRFDNRDTGRSTWIDAKVDFNGAFSAWRAGEAVEGAPYDLSDLAADTVAVLDAVGVERAHVFGMSMGGMIAQQVAIDHPDRVLSLISVMSTTGEPEYGKASKEAFGVLTAAPPRTAEEAGDAALAAAKVIGSPAHLDEAWLRARAVEAFERASNPKGIARQLVAIYATGSRAAGLAGLKVPTCVIHGALDPLVGPDGGRRTAELVPDAELHMIDGMGHDLPPGLWGTIGDLVAAHVARSSA